MDLPRVLDFPPDKRFEQTAFSAAVAAAQRYPPSSVDRKRNRFVYRNAVVYYLHFVENDEFFRTVLKRRDLERVRRFDVAKKRTFFFDQPLLPAL